MGRDSNTPSSDTTSRKHIALSATPVHTTAHAVIALAMPRQLASRHRATCHESGWHCGLWAGPSEGVFHAI